LLLVLLRKLVHIYPNRYAQNSDGREEEPRTSVEKGQRREDSQASEPEPEHGIDFVVESIDGKHADCVHIF
jgi:hypothetical protein